jgi:hypothetical protein
MGDPSAHQELIPILEGRITVLTMWADNDELWDDDEHTIDSRSMLQ